MPLAKGCSKKTQGKNFHLLAKEGKYKPAQRVAIVLSQARRTGRGKCKAELDAAAKRRGLAQGSASAASATNSWPHWRAEVSRGLEQHGMDYEDYSRSFFLDQFNSGVTPRQLVLGMYEESRPRSQRRRGYAGHAAGRAVGYHLTARDQAKLAQKFKEPIERAKWVTTLQHAERITTDPHAVRFLRTMIAAHKRGEDTRFWTMPKHVRDAILQTHRVAGHDFGRSRDSTPTIPNGRVSRAGLSRGRIASTHLKADAKDFAYIKHEAKDIERAVSRLSARDKMEKKKKKPKASKKSCSCKH